MTRPPFNITVKILNSSTEIGRLLGLYEGLIIPKPKPLLRRQNRIKTIQSSLGIEGNTLTLEQITALLDNKHVLGPKKDILEVKNAIAAYDHLLQYNPLVVRSLLSAHRLLMNGLIPESGCFRSSDVGIFKGKSIAHVAPPAKRVPSLIAELFDFLKKDKKTPLLIKACVFHYELEFIHPFSDGNGRVGRLWQQVTLMKYHPLFEYIPVETVIRNKQQSYYQALEASDQAANSTVFIEFSLDTLVESLGTFVDELKPEPQTVEKRLEMFREHLKEGSFSRKDYLRFFKTLSSATASRDLRYGAQKKLLKKSGDRALTRYRFI